MKAEQLTSEQKHTIVVAAAEDKKANYLTSIDLVGKSLIADYFVICSGTSNIHIRAIADGIMEEMEKHGHRREMIEGYSEASWILLSYGDVIAHIMSETQRDFYKLEKLWTAPSHAEAIAAEEAELIEAAEAAEASEAEGEGEEDEIEEDELDTDEEGDDFEYDESGLEIEDEDGDFVDEDIEGEVAPSKLTE